MQFNATHHRALGAPFRLRTDLRRTILTDEAVTFESTLTVVEARNTPSVTLQQQTATGWVDATLLWVTNKPTTMTGRVQLDAGTSAIRCRMAPTADRRKPTFTDALAVDVRRAPRVLLLFSMGGAWTGAPPAPDGDPNAQARLVDHGIRVDEARCRVRGIPADLIRTLVTNRNVQCNDLCDRDCTNFFEHLGLRLMNDEGLASEMKSISNAGYCHRRTNDAGLDNTIILGKWENSKLEPVRPAGIRTWEDILDEYHDDGGRHIILVGQSHGCAKFAGMTRDHWRWGSLLDVDLFVSWDGADLGGGVASVGDVPKAVLAFYQRDDLANWQNGNHIEQATEEHDLTKLFSHNAIARSAFVHEKTATFIRDTVGSVRGRSRGGDVLTYRMDADGSLGERVELRNLPGGLAAACVSRFGETRYAHFFNPSGGRVLTRSLDAHGMLGPATPEQVAPAGVTSATTFSIGDAVFALLQKDLAEDTTIVRMMTNGHLGSMVHHAGPGSPLRGRWDFADAFRAGGRQFVVVGRTGGDLRFVRLQANGTPDVVVPGPIWGIGRLSAVACFAVGASSYLFTIGDGRSVYRLNDDGSVGTRVWHENTALGQMISVVAAHLQVGDAHSLFLLDAVGTLHIRRIMPDGTIGTTLSQVGIGRSGQQVVTVYAIGDVGYASFLQRANT